MERQTFQGKNHFTYIRFYTAAENLRISKIVIETKL